MSQFSERGYVIRETGPVYYTKNVDETARWFEKTLGWYSSVDERDEKGAGRYGCVFDIPPEIEMLHIAPFTGIHLMYGEPKAGAVALMKVNGLQALHDRVVDRVVDSGWTEITAVTEQPWGAKLCRVTTPDGCELQFFE
jgi:AraC family transcriptional regulator